MIQATKIGQSVQKCCRRLRLSLIHCGKCYCETGAAELFMLQASGSSLYVGISVLLPGFRVAVCLG